jgi:FKBP-type peptidyl-prolyl cis-trans isomerases 2
MAKKINPITKIFRGSASVLLILLIVVTAFSGCLGSGAKKGDTVLVYYTGTLDDGTVFDTNVGEQPLAVVLGQPGFIPGFEKALYGMKVNKTKKVVIQPEDAYTYNPELVLTSDKEEVVAGLGAVPNVGDQIPGFIGGRMVLGSVIEVTETTVVIDFNSPLVGKVLIFELTVAEIQKSEAS